MVRIGRIEVDVNELNERVREFYERWVSIKIDLRDVVERWIERSGEPTYVAIARRKSHEPHKFVEERLRKYEEV